MSGQENAARLARATLETVHRIETDSSFLREFLRVPADRRACHPALAAGHLAAFPSLTPGPSPPSTTQLAALIEAHRAARATFCAAIDP
jgi:hypothetical protein